MLPKQNRLPSFEIKNVLRSKTRVSCPEFTLVYQKNKRSVPRFAVIVGSSIDKHATGRNRMKRLIRQSFRRLLPNVPTGFDYICVVRANFKDKTQGEIEKKIIKLLP